MSAPLFLGKDSPTDGSKSVTTSIKFPSAKLFNAAGSNTTTSEPARCTWFLQGRAHILEKGIWRGRYYNGSEISQKYIKLLNQFFIPIPSPKQPHGAALLWVWRLRQFDWFGPGRWSMTALPQWQRLMASLAKATPRPCDRFGACIYMIAYAFVCTCGIRSAGVYSWYIVICSVNHSAIISEGRLWNQGSDCFRH